MLQSHSRSLTTQSVCTKCCTVVRRLHTTPTAHSDCRRVVVTGLGLVTPLATGVDATWSALINGKSGITDITHFINSKQYKDVTSHVGGIVQRGPYTSHQFQPDEWVSRQLRSTASPFIQYAMSAATQALTDAQWKCETEHDSDRTGVCIGSGIGSIEDSYIAGAATYGNTAGADSAKPHKLSAYQIPRLLVNLAAGHVSIQHKLRGPNHAVSTACTTGAHAVADAYRLIRDDDADVIVCGGTEASLTADLDGAVLALQSTVNEVQCHTGAGLQAVRSSP